MNQTQVAKIEPERQVEEPARPRKGGRCADPEAITEALVLPEVLGIAEAQWFAVAANPVKEDCVEFMITHHGHRQTVVNKATHLRKNGRVIGGVYRGTCVDQITQKRDLVAHAAGSQASV